MTNFKVAEEKSLRQYTRKEIFWNYNSILRLYSQGEAEKLTKLVKYSMSQVHFLLIFLHLLQFFTNSNGLDNKLTNFQNISHF